MKVEPWFSETKSWFFEKTNTIKSLNVFSVRKEAMEVTRDGAETLKHMGDDSRLRGVSPTHIHSVTILGWFLLLRCQGWSSLLGKHPLLSKHFTQSYITGPGPILWHVFLTCLLACLHPFIRKMANTIRLHGTMSSLLLGSIAVTCRRHAVPLQAVLVVINDFCVFISSSFHVTVEKQDKN